MKISEVKEAKINDVKTRSKFRSNFMPMAILVSVLVIVSAFFSVADGSVVKDKKDDKSNKKESIQTAAACGAGPKITFILDRSSSIGSPANGQDNVNAIKFGVGATFQALMGTGAETDLIVFGTEAVRVNSGGYYPLTGQAEVNWQSFLLSNTPWKVGASLNQDAYGWPDRFDYNSEGLTNWEGALQQVVNQAPYIGYPNLIIMFTDGNPTTNIGEVNSVAAAGGNFGSFTGNDTSVADLFSAVNVANFLRSQGTTIVPVGVGAINKANLDALGGGFSLLSTDYGSFLANINLALAQLGLYPPTPCTTTSTLGMIATNSDTGAILPVRFDYTGSPFGGPQFDSTSGWSYKSGNTSGPWGFNTSYDASSVPANLTFDGAYCRMGAWDPSSPLVGVQTGNGINAGGIPSGQTVRCEYKFRDARTIVPLPQLQVSLLPGAPSSIFEEQGGQTVGIRVTNPGGRVVSGVRVSSPNYTTSPGQDIPAGQYRDYYLPVSAPLGFVASTIAGSFSAKGIYTINPATEKFDPSLGSPPVLSSSTAEIYSNTVTHDITVNRIKIPV